MTDEQFNKTAPPAEVKTAPPSPKTSGQLGELLELCPWFMFDA